MISKSRTNVNFDDFQSRKTERKYVHCKKLQFGIYFDTFCCKNRKKDMLDFIIDKCQLYFDKFCCETIE